MIYRIELSYRPDTSESQRLMLAAKFVVALEERGAGQKMLQKQSPYVLHFSIRDPQISAEALESLDPEDKVMITGAKLYEGVT